MADEEKWVPDRRTLQWCFGAADEARVKDAIRRDVESRSSGLSIDSDVYWTLVAEAAIEAVLYDLSALADQEPPGKNIE
ncbi:hypothetical protein FAF44_49535 [Nonomuraea sp. MG754425]|uniref:hypothetical protein n=1 Tax=Nonomuraea sp. MG754425 TaxID=2570319 RepID=UPI001F1D00EC|nr:hypothetical protein [Nonomuraea sp. MG754425]MCF6476332.1 hypothetical protein [Nonomuraea sp. MG754425]